jgi:chromosome partitioning protein
VLLDCPPSIGMLTVNALAASDYLLMPLTPEYLSLKGASSFLRHLEMIRRLNARLTLLGFVLTKYDARKTMTGEVEAQLRQDHGNDTVFETRIRNSIALAKAQKAGIDALTFDRASNGSADYRDLATEFLAKTREP